MIKWSALTLVLMGIAVSAGAEPSARVGHKASAWQQGGLAAQKAAMKMGDAYRRFIDTNRTEREVVGAALRTARKKGFVDLFAGKAKATPGAKLMASQHGKIAAFVIVGTKPLSEGVHVVAAHVDSVRIDLKQTPLYADGNMALLETHYYGGIKSYQWLSQPLQLRGVVVRKDGKVIPVSIGDDPNEPVFVIPDVAVHMSRYVDRREGEDLPGESLDPIISSTPGRAIAGKGKRDPYAAEATRLIESQLGIKIGDLASAELELVPAATARDVGLDKAIVGGYGQDDRACVYAALEALWDVKKPAHTAIVVLVDKEEVGSAGNSGAKSNFLQRVIAELLEGQGTSSTAAALAEVFASSIVFSADTSGAVNPHYKSLYDVKNASFLGGGVIWDQSGVHAEVLGYVRSLFDKSKITHQASNWGKTRGSKGDEGTVLNFFTRLGMDGLDVSIPLLSMHSTFELVSKVDLYQGYRAYKAFLSD
jgi:aspartyl aminopeptidase